MKQVEDTKTLALPGVWVCDTCGRKMTDYFELGYDGPADPSMVNTCHPFMPWKQLCRGCANGTP